MAAIESQSMMIPDAYSAHADAFAEFIRSYFPTASVPEIQKMAIAFCKGIDAASGIGILERTARGTDTRKRRRKASDPNDEGG